MPAPLTPDKVRYVDGRRRQEFVETSARRLSRPKAGIEAGQQLEGGQRRRHVDRGRETTATVILPEVLWAGMWQSIFWQGSLETPLSDRHRCRRLRESQIASKTIVCVNASRTQEAAFLANEEVGRV